MAIGDMVVPFTLDNSENYEVDINPETRIINVPEDFILGVESDEKAQRVFFTCPKIVGYDFDMSKASVYINFENANGEKDAYRVEDLNVNEELEEVTFSWLLSRKVTAYKGQVNFIVCAKISNESGIIQQEWNTTVATAISLVGLEAIAQIEQENYDILEEILRKVKNIEENGVDVDLSAYQKKTDNELKTKNKTIVGAINEIKDNQKDLPIASSTQLGGVKPVDKTSQMTENIGVDSQGRLYRTKDITEEERTKWNRNGDYNNLDNKPTIPKEIIVDAELNETSTNAIQNQAVAKELAEKLSKNGLKTINGESLVGSGNIELSAGDNAYELPIANNEVLGGVMPIAKTAEMSQGVGVDENGRLFTFPSGNSSTNSYTNIRIDKLASGTIKSGTTANTAIETGVSYDVLREYDVFEICMYGASDQGTWSIYPQGGNTSPWARISWGTGRSKVVFKKLFEDYYEPYYKEKVNTGIITITPTAQYLNTMMHKSMSYLMKLDSYYKGKTIMLLSSTDITADIAWAITACKFE